jgi:hypothetical protein
MSLFGAKEQWHFVRVPRKLAKVSVRVDDNPLQRWQLSEQSGMLNCETNISNI